MSATMLAMFMRAISASVGGVTTALNEGIAGVSGFSLSEVVSSGSSVASGSREIGRFGNLLAVWASVSVAVLLTDELALPPAP